MWCVLNHIVKVSSEIIENILYGQPGFHCSVCQKWSFCIPFSNSKERKYECSWKCTWDFEAHQGGPGESRTDRWETDLDSEGPLNPVKMSKQTCCADKSKTLQRYLRWNKLNIQRECAVFFISLPFGPTWKSSLSITVSELLCRVSLVRLDMSLNNPAGRLSR